MYVDYSLKLSFHCHTHFELLQPEYHKYALLKWYLDDTWPRFESLSRRFRDEDSCRPTKLIKSPTWRFYRITFSVALNSRSTLNKAFLPKITQKKGKTLLLSKLQVINNDNYVLFFLHKTALIFKQLKHFAQKKSSWRGIQSETILKHKGTILSLRRCILQKPVKPIQGIFIPFFFGFCCR